MNVGAMASGLAGHGLRALGQGADAVRASAEAVLGDLNPVDRGPNHADPLSERDPDFIRATLPAYSALTDLYFRPKVRGLEHIPAEGPVLLVGNHSGGTLIADTFALTYAFCEYFGTDRSFHQLAHDLAVWLPGLSALIRRYGTVAANHRNAELALSAGAAVLVYPGGDHETYRPSWQSSEIDFADRSGFVRLALAQKVPIVPVVSIGGQETALFITRGRRLARALGLDRRRLKVMPIQMAPPWGVTVFDLPVRLPLPAEITIQVLPPIDLAARFGPDPSERAVYEAITADMQAALSGMASERDLPVVGKVGSRPSEPPVPPERLPGAEPWPGYDEQTVPEIKAQLNDASAGTCDRVRLYEKRHKARKGVLQAT
jgi:1-acyl-sn-glycerol-3-phosphate acyltransferase